MAVKFAQMTMSDMNPSLTLEDVYQMYTSFAGVFKTEFESLAGYLR